MPLKNRKDDGFDHVDDPDDGPDDDSDDDSDDESDGGGGGVISCGKRYSWPSGWGTAMATVMPQSEPQITMRGKCIAAANMCPARIKGR
jgi:hypothetical protein